MGIRPNYSNYQDDICLKSNKALTLGGDQKYLLIDHHYIRPLDSLWLVHSVIFNIISKNDTHCMYWSPTGELTDRYFAVIWKLFPMPVEPVFLHQPYLDLTGLSSNSPFGPIIHGRRRGHHRIKGKAWNPKEAITLGFNCVSSKCQSTPDVWESSASL